MTQNYAFKDILAVEYRLARPKVSLQGFKPYSQVEKTIDKDISNISKESKKKEAFIKSRRKETSQQIKTGYNNLFERDGISSVLKRI